MDNNLKITGPWTEADRDYRREYATTNDPRVLAVVEREACSSDVIDGDAFAPAAWITYHGVWTWSKAGNTYQDDDAMEAYVTALNHYGSAEARNDGMVMRYMAAFHGTTVREVEVYRGDVVVILNTPAWREHIDLDDTRLDRARILDNDVQTWRAVRDGEVYGVGYATRETHVLDDGEPIDLDDWDVEIQCWGFIGESYAKNEAAAFSYGAPDLPALLGT